MPFLGSWCAQCGPHVSVDEDGCCNSCGCSAVGQGADEAHAAIASLRARLAKLEAVVEAAREEHRILARDRARTGWGSNDMIYAMCQTSVALRALDEDSGGSGASPAAVADAEPTPEPAGSSPRGCREAFCPHTPILGPTTPSEMAADLMGRAEKEGSDAERKNPMIDPKNRWRVEVVLAAARWAQNILVEVQGNHAAFIPQETRERLHTAIRQLSEIPHTVPTHEAPPSRAALTRAEQMAESERRAVRRGR